MNFGLEINFIYGAAAVAMMVMVFLSLIRAIIGPTAADRVAAINIIGTKTVVMIALISRLYNQGYYLDIAMVYALMSFMTTIGVAKYLEKGGLR